MSACEQCGRNRLPSVEVPRPLLSYLGALAPTQVSAQVLRLILEPDRDQQPQGGERAFQFIGPPAAAGAEIAIGPEGGFALEELDAFELSSFARVGLGPRVLRTETAAIAAIVVLQARFGDMSATSDGASRTTDA